MSDLKQRIANLSPEKRALLEKGAGRRPQSTQIPKRDPASLCPLSFSQQRLWLLDQMDPGNPAYNVFRGIVLRGPLDVAALERTLQEIVRRHEALRTTFLVDEGSPVQQVNDASVHLSILDFSQLPLEEARAKTLVFANGEAERRFDLRKDVFVRAWLCRLAVEEQVLILTMHHIAVDGYSVGIVFQELATIYASFAAGAPSPLPELTLQFADYATWERQYFNTAALDELLQFWRKQVSGMPGVLHLPVDHHRPPLQSSHGGRHYFRLPRVPLDRLKTLAKEAQATLFMALLGAFQALLSLYGGQREFGVGSPMACRELEGIDSLIGCFSNTVVLRADFTRDPTFLDTLARVREVVLAALSHQRMPFDKLVEAVNPPRDPSRNALVQVNFRLLSTAMPRAAGEPHVRVS